MPRFVRDQARHRLAPIHADGLVEPRVDRPCQVPHVVAADLVRAVCKAGGEARAVRQQQQPRRLDRVAGHANDPGGLPVQVAIHVSIDHRVRLARCVMRDPDYMAVGPQVEQAGLQRPRDFPDHDGPFRARLVALEVETVLNGRRAAVIGFGVGGVRPGRIALVADTLGAIGEDLVVVVRRKRRAPAPVGRAHRILGPLVIGFEVLERDGPVQKAGALDLAIGAQRLELVRLKARGCTGPMGRRATDGLDDPSRQGRKVLGDAPRPARGARVQPGHLVEGLPFIVLVILVLQVGPGFQHDAFDALPRQLMGQCPAARARSNDDDGRFVQCDLLHASSPSYSSIRGSGSQSRSLNPRLM